MFRSIAGGICDCGDITVMNAQGFCKHHGPNRIPNSPVPVKLLCCTEIILPRLVVIDSCFSFSLVLANTKHRNDLECCICRNEEKTNPLGLVVRLIDTGGKSIRIKQKTRSNHSLHSIEQFLECVK